MKKKVFAMAMILGFIWGVFAFAGDKCPLIEKTFTIEIEGVQHKLSKFDSQHCYFDSLELSFVCGNEIFISGYPCGLNYKGDLECWLVKNYHQIQIGAKTWYVPKDTKMLYFDLVSDSPNCNDFLYYITHLDECQGNSDNSDDNSNNNWTCPYSLGHHSYCAVCEEGDANKDGTAGCDEGEGWCSGSWHCAAGLICDPETHKCAKPK